MFVFMGVIGSILFYANALALCYGTSPNLTAATANYSDVNDCVTAATYGDTINIPACAEGACVWVNQVTITKDIKIRGAGIDSTYITSGLVKPAGDYISIFKFVPDATARNNLDSLTEDTNMLEVSGITFTTSAPSSGVYALRFYNTTTPSVRRIRIHDNKFVNWNLTLYSYGNIYGVVYNNQFVNARGPKVGGNGYKTFESDRYTLGSGKGWYIEDNVFTMSGVPNIMVASGANDGGGYVARYNTVTGTLAGGETYFETHGNQLAGIYGPQITEVYGNYIPAIGANRATNARGGKNIYLNNVMAVGNMQIWEEYSDLATSITYPSGRCAENERVSRQSCTDSCICQKVHDSYFINNRSTATGSLHAAYVAMDFECREALSSYCTSIKTNNPPELVENIEFFNYVPAGFNGTAGVGCGTLANRPSTCSKGVGYWVPNTSDDPNASSCTNLTGFVGKNPTYSRPGTLYKCTSANTWTAWYTPFTYPHPLRSGSIATTTTPPPPPATETTVSEPTTTTPTIITVRKTAPGQIKKIFNR